MYRSDLLIKAFFRNRKFINSITLGGKITENKLIELSEKWVICGFINRDYYTNKNYWYNFCAA